MTKLQGFKQRFDFNIRVRTITYTFFIDAYNKADALEILLTDLETVVENLQNQLRAEQKENGD